MKVSSTWIGLGLLAALACDKGPSVQPEPTAVVPPVEASGSVEWPDEPFRAERPKPAAATPLELPSMTHFVLTNGLEVNLVEQQTLPTLTLHFEWDQGVGDDPRNKVGLASICGDLLDESTKDLDHSAFLAKQADHAISLSSGASGATTTVSLRTLVRELGPALDLTAQLLLSPGMRQADFDRLVTQEKTGIEQQKSSPTGISSRLWGSLIWGGQHPYGKIETAKSVDAIRLADCEAWVGKLRPEGARVWVVGKIDAESLRKELEARFAGWTGKGPKHKKLPKAKPAKGTIFFVHVEGAAQSQISVGHPGPDRGAADYEATQMVGAILGGSFSSRLNMNLREDKGWAYGARGGFTYYREGSVFAAASSVRTDATGGALREMAKEIEVMRTTDPTPEELAREREGAMQAVPAIFATASRTLSAFQNLAFHGLPSDWYEGYGGRLQALDIAAVRKAAETHLQAGDFVVLVVGDGSVILPELERIAEEKLFGKGGLLFLDADGNPLDRDEVLGQSEKPVAK